MPGGEGEGKERGRERDRLSYNSILLVRAKEEKRSNKTRPIFGKEVTGKEKGLQRAALGKDGGTAKIEVSRESLGKVSRTLFPSFVTSASLYTIRIHT